MMSSISNIINLLKGKTHTLGWDAVVAYDRQKVNHLLQQQYVSKLAAGTHFPPITWENKNKTIRFENLILGTPLISFEDATTENSRVSAVLEFIGGNIVEKNSNSQVTNYIRVRPGTGIKMQLSIDLTAGQGSIDEKGKILVNFRKGNILKIDLNLTNELLAEVKEYFTSWLQNNPVIYELGKLLFKDLNTKLTPKKFIIRTQCAPGAALLDAVNYGDGAVLLFIATEYHPDGGTLPTNNYPWLIPKGNSSTILINNRVVIEHYIKPSLDKILMNGEWKLVRGTGSNDAFYLKASDNATIHHTSFIAKRDKSEVWTGAAIDHGILEPELIYEDFNYSLKGAVFDFNSDTVEVKFDSNNKFVRRFGVQIYYPAGIGEPAFTWHTANITFSMQGNFVYAVVLNADDKSVNFKFKENNTSMNSDFKEKLNASIILLGDELIQKMNDFMKDAYKALINISFSDINVFSVDKVLFPEQNINQLESVYFPGDLLLLGNIDSNLTSLTLSPLTSTIATGGKVIFTTNTDDDVTYTLSSKDAGRITSDGVYYAPDSLRAGTLNVMVTAKTKKGASASALITVVPISILITPSLTALNEDNLYPVKFEAKILGADRTFDKWTLSSSNPKFVGTIDQSGVYTPPVSDTSHVYPEDYTYVTVTAVASDGKTSKAYVMLVGNGTYPEFKVLPPFASVLPKIPQKFTSKKTRDFDPDTWTQYPELGTLSKVEEEKGVYSVNYTAPDKLTGDELVIIRAIQKNKVHRAGYSIVDLTGGTQSTYDKDNIE